MNKTNWKTIKSGTPVLFRLNKDSEYERGTWFGGVASYGVLAGAFYWVLYGDSGYLDRDFGATVAENGEWHIDPFWCKLAEEEKTTLSREHAQAVSVLVTERLNELELKRDEARAGIRYWYSRCADDTEEGREAYAQYNRLQNLRRATEVKLKKWRKVKRSIHAVAHDL